MNRQDRVWVSIRSEMGPISVEWGPCGLSRILLNHRRHEVGKIENEFRSVLDRLEQYLSGREVDFSQVPLDLSEHTEFRKKVLTACGRIPYGNVSTYGALARQAGSPRAARAVGQALARNTLPIVIPCHRVVADRGPGGFMGRFPGGMEWKRYLLQLEGYEL